MKIHWRRFFLKTLKVCGVTIGSILAILFILPFLFPKTISTTVKKWINESITSKMDFSDARFTFFRHFPSLTFSLDNVSITGSAPFQKDTLLSAQDMSFGVNLLSLLSSSVKVNQIFISGADINVQVDEKGNANYNIYQSAGSKEDTTTSQAGLQLENIVIDKSNLVYNDRSVPIEIGAQNLSYKGSGDLSKAVFDMATRLRADSFSLTYDGQQYINKKQLRARLVTAINTNALSLIFGDNWLRINTLPVKFSGSFDFLPHGYKMNLKVESRKATLENIISAIPPDMAGWIKNTKMGGDAIFRMELNGSYDRQSGQMPDFLMKLNIRNGFIANKEAAVPLQNLVVGMDARLPAMNTDSMEIDLDSLYFTVGKGFFKMHSHSVGMQFPFVDAAANADLDLGAWNKAIGMKGLELRGQYKMDFKIKGKYQKGQNPDNFRRDIVIRSIPSFAIRSEVRNGYFKFASVPEAVHDISFAINSSCPDNNYRHTKLTIENIHLAALKNVFEGYIRFTDPDAPHIDAGLRGNINLSDIARLVPVEQLKLDGIMNVDINSKGIYDPHSKSFPITNMKLSVADGKILTKHFPEPIEHIKMLAEIKNSDGKLSGTTIEIQPISFDFAGQPFMLKANLDNPDNISYDIVSKGTLDLGKLYKVFGVAGYNASGFIKADVDLKGRQSDAEAGRYQLLNNSGTLQLKDIRLQSQLFPKPLVIHTGDFRFRQDKMIFDRFESSYGNMDFAINGYLTNVIAYALQPDGTLKGKLSLAADKINLNEFTTFDNPGDDITRAGTDSSGTGVILIPKNVSLLFTANVKKADYDSVAINDFAGQLFVDSGKVKLEQTHFKLADATFNMDATYEGLTPHKGIFDFKVIADSFSIAEAYRDIPMFREMATSASGVQGIVGLDYQLSGRLDQNMMPVYPSLKGGGVINLKKVKLKGFKLMNAVSRGTERSELKDPALSGINIKTTVNNNIITIDRVKLRIFGFRPRFEGQVSLDGELNIKGRLGLPPFGIFGIPFTVSGTSEDPVVKLKKDKNGKVLQEKEDTEEDDDVPAAHHQ